MIIRTVAGGDLERVAALEAAGYPADEAASPERLAERIARARACFRVALAEDGSIVGFVCGTRSAGAELTHETMHRHEPAGASLCIHSVVVDAARRRRGIARAMLRDYRDHARGLPGVERLLLICKEHLIGLYAGAGFELLGPSPVVVGRDPWFAMRLELGSET